MNSMSFYSRAVTRSDTAGPKVNAPNAEGQRPYRSPLRAQRAEETRAKVISTASRLFTTKGWAPTGMREVASGAGVAIETVYSHFSSKRRLLDAVIDVAVVGDEAPIAVAERPEFAELGRGSRARRVAAAASLVTSIHERSAPFAKLIREAASNDEQMAEVLRATRERQRRDVESGMALIIERTPTAAERDGAWAMLSPEVYLLLVDESGWTPEQYERWVAETLDRVLPRS